MILSLLVVVIVGAILLAVITDRPITTPIPRSALVFVRDVRRGPVVLTVWRAVLLITLLGGSLLLATSGGIVAGFIAAIIITMLIQDSVREFVSDLWHMRFVRVDP